MTGINVMCGRIGSWVNRYSPQILIGTGIALSVGAAVTTAIAVKKTQPAVDTLKEDVVQIHTDVDNGAMEKSEGKKALALTYRRNGLEIAKWYSIPTGLMVGSIGCTLAGFGIINNRYGAASFMAASLSTTLAATYKRLEEDLGEDKAKNYIYGTKDEVVKEVETDPETGETKKVKRTIKVSSDDNLFPAIDFDGGPKWEPDLKFCEYTLDNIQQWADRKHMIEKTPMFLDEVLGREYLALPIRDEKLAKYAHYIGWPADVHVTLGHELTTKIDENGNKHEVFVLHFPGLSADPWTKEKDRHE